MPGGTLRLPGAAMRSASRPRFRTWNPGLVCRLELRRRPVRLRLAQVNDRDVPGPVVSPGGAWIGVPHGALEVAERPAGIEVQRREGVSYHARSQAAGQIGRQAGPCGEAAHDPPYVGGKQPPPRPGGEQHRDVCQIGSPGEIGVYPGSSRAGAGENLLRRPAAARTIGRYGGRRSGAMSQTRRSPQEGGPAPADLEFAAALLPLWGFPPGTGVAPSASRGPTTGLSWCATGSSAMCCGSAGSCPSPRSAPRQPVRLRRATSTRSPPTSTAASWSSPASYSSRCLSRSRPPGSAGLPPTERR